MSTPTVRKEAGPTVKYSATMADAQLVVQISMAGFAAGADRGYEILFAYPKPATLAQLRKEHPRLSEEYRQVMAALAQCETISTFVKQGLLDEALIHDLYWTAGTWKAAAEICRGLRKEGGEPRLFENFEWLAGRRQ